MIVYDGRDLHNCEMKICLYHEQKWTHKQFSLVDDEILICWLIPIRTGNAILMVISIFHRCITSNQYCCSTRIAPGIAFYRVPNLWYWELFLLKREKCLQRVRCQFSANATIERTTSLPTCYIECVASTACNVLGLQTSRLIISNSRWKLHTFIVGQLQRKLENGHAHITYIHTHAYYQMTSICISLMWMQP